MHAIGFYHEQNRSDRDQHLTIQMDNVIPEMVDQFTLLSEKDNRILDKWDDLSVMLYGGYAFASEPDQRTMISRNNPERELFETYEKSGLTMTDAIIINKLYVKAGECHQRSKYPVEELPHE